METVDDIIISDIHLGSKLSRSKELIQTLNQFIFKKLILNGDIFNDLNFKRLDKDDWNFLSYIRTLADSNVEVVWIRGNHDNLLIDLTSHFLGIDSYQEYQWVRDNKKNLAIHGDQFDSFLVKNKTFGDMASYLYFLLQ